MRALATLLSIALAASLFSSLLGCPRAEAPPGAQEQPKQGKLVVFAAASLREVFTQLEGDFQRSHPGVEVTFNFAGSQELRTQLEQGAVADIFASADTHHLEVLARTARVSPPTLFARNSPVLVVARESEATIRSLADLPSARRIVIGAPEVPIGRYTLQLLDNAGRVLGSDFRARVEARVVSRELNVRQVLNKVSLGEAQAGFVYRTDARAAKPPLAQVELPAELNVVADYPVAVVAGAPHPTLARAWIALLLSARGQSALAEAGFLPPPGSQATP
jgi:molybdate transport system substrate-binding protein